MPTLGAIACGHPVTASAAREVLEAGGNAFDAVIAAQFAACVAEPVLTSLGGGGFLLAHRSGSTPRLYDFFAQTPKARKGRSGALYPMEADFGPATQTFHIGPGSVATPGTVAGMFTIHAELASLPMASLVTPAVRAAREGVRVNDFQRYIFDVVEPIYTGLEPYAAVFNDRPHQQPELAATLEALCEGGADLFYRGTLGERLVDTVAAAGGHLSLDDLDAYQVIKREPLALEFAGFQILTNPPPSAGGVLMAHTLTELARSATAAPMDLVRAMAATNAARATLLPAAQITRGTTHISVADTAGNLAAMTLSNGEGARCLIPDTGVMLNNMLGEEDINPGGIGFWPEDVRLGSMMAPTVLLEPLLGHRYALGSGGSNRIRSALVQVIVQLLAHGRTATEAVAAPRLHLEGDLLSLEPGFDGAVNDLSPEVSNLQQWSEQNLFFGGVHLVGSHDDGRFEAVGDTRRGGVGELAVL